MKHRTIRGRAIIALAAVALAAAACASDTGSEAAADGATSTTVEATTAPTTAETATEDNPSDTDMDDMGDRDMDDADMGDAEGEHTDHDADAGDHDHMTVEATEGMSVDMAVTEVGEGWQVEVATTGFTFTPENKDGPHVAGEGHAHLYVNGEKLATMLEPIYLIESLAPGVHTIKVDLRSNDHAAYELDGEALAVSTEIAVAGEVEAADAIITVEVSGGSVVEDLGRVEVNVGDDIELTVKADVADEVHVHGYDVFGDVTPDHDATVRFTADTPGIFEIELEDAGLLLLELQVNG